MGKVVDNKILFLTLRVFSATGGIEKVCRVLGKALNEIATAGKGSLEVLSMYGDAHAADNNPYFPAGIFTGYSQSKWRCALAGLKKGYKKDVVILSHVNLLPIGWLIKKMSPATKLILLTHGIEIWQPLGRLKKKMLSSCDLVISVSEFTKMKLVSVQGMPVEKCRVIHNCLDPFLLPPPGGLKRTALRKKYGLDEDDFIFFTLTRLARTERHKGYGKVIHAIAAHQPQTGSRIAYLIAGKSTDEEAAYIRTVAAKENISEKVILAGFIAEEDIADYFEMADCYIMPSSKEGFGLTFIEAMNYGLPVIAGNRDGSVDALAGGQLGILVDPDDNTAIAAAMVSVIKNREAFLPDQFILQQKFNYEKYKLFWKEVVNN